MKDSFLVTLMLFNSNFCKKLPHACEMNVEGLDSDNQYKISNLKNSMFTTYYVIPQDISTAFTTQHPGDCVTVWLRDSNAFFSWTFMHLSRPTPPSRNPIPIRHRSSLHNTTQSPPVARLRPDRETTNSKKENNTPKTPKTKEIPQLFQHVEAAAATIVTIVV